MKASLTVSCLLALVCLVVIAPVLSDAAAEFKRVHSKKTATHRAHIRAALHTTHAKSHRHNAMTMNRGHDKARQNGGKAASMCKAILDAIFPGLNIGSSLTQLSDAQAMACWCLWAKTTRASGLTSAMYRFYNPFPARKLADLGKDLLDAAWDAWGDANSRQTNLISRRMMGAYNRSPAEGCFNSGGALESMCSMITDNCKLFDCMTAPDGSSWLVSPVGECERSSTFSWCANNACRANPKNACPIGGDTMCRCASGTVVNSCTCVTRLPQSSSSYCSSTAKLATL